MLLNYSMPQLAPNIVTAPKSNIDVNALLGLRSSPYQGLQQVGNQNLYYGDGGFYQPYTPSPTRYYTLGFMNQPQYWQPSLMMGMGSPSVGNNFGMGTRWHSTGGPEAGTIYKGDQAFKPYTGNIPAGFVKVGDEYEPSMAYVNANTPKPTFNATPNVTSFLSTPTANVYNGNYGAGRFLNTGNLLGFNFGTPSGQTTGGETTS